MRKMMLTISVLSMVCLSPFGVAESGTTGAISSAAGCQVRPAYDFSGPAGEPDCKVDLFDFAEFAAAWLECSLIPESACAQ